MVPPSSFSPSSSLHFNVFPCIFVLLGYKTILFSGLGLLWYINVSGRKSFSYSNVLCPILMTHGCVYSWFSFCQINNKNMLDAEVSLMF